MEFPRTPRRTFGSLNLTPLIDVLFILIIFFMLTTSFMKVESMEIILPSSAYGKTVNKQDAVHLFIYANGDIALGQRKVDPDSLADSLSRIFERDPNTKVMLLTAEGVTMQQLVTVMDRVYLSGGKSLFVRKWEDKKA